MRKILSMALLMAWSVTILGGCAMYVNIPAQPGDMARSNPNDQAVQQVSAEALRAVVADHGMQGAFQIVLPAGTDPEHYEQVAMAVDDQAAWSATGQRMSEMSAFEVRQVRVRGWRAQVDVIRPATIDPQRQELVTAYLRRYPIGGWATYQLYIWRLPVEEALRESARTGSDPQ